MLKPDSIVVVDAHLSSKTNYNYLLVISFTVFILLDYLPANGLLECMKLPCITLFSIRYLFTLDFMHVDIPMIN